MDWPRACDRLRSMGRLILILCLLAAPAVAGPSTIEGTVERWRDGDTPVLIVDGKLMPVRLHGLHAPEDGEPGYAEATAFMVELVGAQPLSCKLTGRMTWDRHEGTCWLGELDIAAELMRAGLGRDCPYHSGGRYAHLETDAGREIQLPAYCRPR